LLDARRRWLRKRQAHRATSSPIDIERGADDEKNATSDSVFEQHFGIHA